MQKNAVPKAIAAMSCIAAIVLYRHAFGRFRLGDIQEGFADPQMNQGIAQVGLMAGLVLIG